MTPIEQQSRQHDLRSEVSFRRLLAQVTGVTRTEPENVLQEFVHAVKRVVAAARAELPEGRTRALPAPNAGPEGESIPCADPSDPEAEVLADFDRENPRPLDLKGQVRQLFASGETLNFP